MITTQPYKPTSLLTTRNAKTIKGEKYGVFTHILYLSPFKNNSQGKNVCPMASPGCAASCLFTAGRGSMANVKKGRTNKTELFLKDRNAFLTLLHSEIAQLEVKHKIEKSKFVVRLNGTSDISWESFKVPGTGKNIFELFPKVQFYDYTKNYLRFDKVMPKNYHLTFSRSETNEAKAMELLKRGFNIAMVFDKLPVKYNSYKVINGDLHDLRHTDGKNVIVGLKYKNNTGKGAAEINRQALISGFVVRTKTMGLPAVEVKQIRKAA